MQKLCVCITIVTSMRAKNLHSAFSDNVTFILWNEAADVPRHYEVVLETMKNDPMGTGPVKDRTFRIPCTCLQHAPKKMRAKLVLELKQNPSANCFSTCPFMITKYYLNIIPDPFGAKRNQDITNGGVLGRLKLIRAMNSRGNPRELTELSLGKYLQTCMLS